MSDATVFTVEPTEYVRQWEENLVTQRNTIDATMGNLKRERGKVVSTIEHLRTIRRNIDVTVSGGPSNASVLRDNIHAVLVEKGPMFPREVHAELDARGIHVNGTSPRQRINFHLGASKNMFGRTETGRYQAI